jgi:DNA-binding MarR family transcriptional regulator
METLETLFSSKARVAILRSFLFQPTARLSASAIAKETGVTTSTVRSHTSDLVAIDFLKETEAAEEAGRSVIAWQLNQDSKLREPLHRIILQHQRVTPEDIAERLKKVGSIKLLVLSGIFSGSDNRPLDVLVAGENIDSAKLSRSLTRIEKSFGTELRYAQLSEDEFTYRHNVYDRLIRDVLDYPHLVLIDELNVT